MRVIENATAPRQLKARSAAQFSDAHAAQRSRKPRCRVEKSQKPVEFRGRVGARGDFEKVGA